MYVYIGVMAARGMLSNPAMYAGYDQTPLHCVQDWVRIKSQNKFYFNNSFNTQ